MIKTLDRYILRQFLFSAVLFFAGLMALRIVVDLSFNLDEFTKRSATGEVRTLAQVLGNICVYYGYQSLTYFRELAGVIIVAASAFTLARMNSSNELTAILASGVSLHRVLLPILLCAIGLNVLIVVDTELLIPPVKERLARERSDTEGLDTFQVRLIGDQHNSIWYSDRMFPADHRLTNPLVVLRDGETAVLAGFLTAANAVYDRSAKAWVFQPAQAVGADPLAHLPRLHLPEARAVATTVFIPTRAAPEDMIEEAMRKPANARVNWSRASAIRGVSYLDSATDLVIAGGRLALAARDGRLTGTVLYDAVFTYRLGKGEPVARFVAPEARYQYNKDLQHAGWALTNGRLLYCSDLTPESLSLRQSSSWMQFMSTNELNQLLALKRVPDPRGAMMVKHCRFADFFNNIILLLVAVPFILSRERNIKSSAGLTVLTVGVAYVFIYASRYMGIPPVVAAWLPILIFGSLGAVMVDSVKT